MKFDVTEVLKQNNIPHTIEELFDKARGQGIFDEYTEATEAFVDYNESLDGVNVTEFASCHKDVGGTDNPETLISDIAGNLSDAIIEYATVNFWYDNYWDGDKNNSPENLAKNSFYSWFETTFKDFLHDDGMLKVGETSFAYLNEDEEVDEKISELIREYGVSDFNVYPDTKRLIKNTSDDKIAEIVFEICGENMLETLILEAEEWVSSFKNEAELAIKKYARSEHILDADELSEEFASEFSFIRELVDDMDAKLSERVQHKDYLKFIPSSELDSIEQGVYSNETWAMSDDVELQEFLDFTEIDLETIIQSIEEEGE